MHPPGRGFVLKSYMYIWICFYFKMVFLRLRMAYCQIYYVSMWFSSILSYFELYEPTFIKT